MKFTLISKIGLLFFLLYFLLMPINVHAQWIPDAYINDFRVNDDATIQQQNYSKIGVDSAGNFVVAWDDDRNFSNNSWHQVYCQVFDKWANRIGNNFRIGQDTTILADIAVLKDGRFIVYWTSYFKFGIDRKYEICFQRFNKTGVALSSILKVVDSNYSYSIYTFQGGGIGMDSLGNFVICWSRGVSISPPYAKVFFQRFDSSGNKIGNVDTVNSTNNRALNPSIAVNKNGSYVISWQDDRINSGADYRFDIFMQRFSSNGVKLGNNIKVNDDTDSTINQYYPSVSSDGKGGFAICWIDGRILFEDNVFYQLYDSNANPVGPNKLASSTTSGFSIGPFPVCSMRSDRYFFIGWTDYTGGPGKFLGRRFDANGNPYGNPSNPYEVPVNSLNVGQYCDDIVILGDKVYSVWTDNRLNNLDIFCNVRGFQNPDTLLGIKNSNEIANEFKLYPAYPNPFNPITNIKYQIPASPFNGGEHVTLKVFDILGKEISTLVNEELKPGTYEVKFNGSNLSSGIYIIHLFTGASQFAVQKMLLIK